MQLRHFSRSNKAPYTLFDLVVLLELTMGNNEEEKSTKTEKPSSPVTVVSL